MRYQLRQSSVFVSAKGMILYFPLIVKPFFRPFETTGSHLAGRLPVVCGNLTYSTVTDFARFFGLSMSQPFSFAA